MESRIIHDSNIYLRKITNQSSIDNIYNIYKYCIIIYNVFQNRVSLSLPFCWFERGWQARLVEKWRIIIGYIREMASGDRGRVEKSVTFLLSRISRKNGA